MAVCGVGDDCFPGVGSAFGGMFQRFMAGRDLDDLYRRSDAFADRDIHQVSQLQQSAIEYVYSLFTRRRQKLPGLSYSFAGGGGGFGYT